MKKTFMMIGIAAMSVCVMTSCGSKDANKEKEGTEQVAENEGNEDDEDAPAPKTEEGVIALLQEAYEDANLISQPDEDDCEPNLDLFGMYCSKEFNEKMEEIRRIEVSSGDEFDRITDEAGMFVYWEGQKSSPKDFDVEIEGNRAYATYNVSNGDDELITVIQLVYEDGQWRIDDWEQIGMLVINLREAMDEFIEAHK